jgi:expansin (peptidoglycan-binding protein)
MTIYNPAGELGACGLPLSDDDPIVALGAPTMGPSTYNVMTGAATNPWCGKKIQISYNGKTTVGTIQDKCPGCAAGDIDLSPKLWKELTGMDPLLGGRFKVEWTAL